MLEDLGEAMGRSEVYVTDGRDGLVVLVPRPDHLLVRDVAVAPERRGHGVGALLMRFAELRAAELGLAELRLFTNEAMWENLRRYPELGYEETGRGEQDGYGRVFFRKRLGLPGGGDRPPT
jgi:GNAT superfamily N-acetyltransferase